MKVLYAALLLPMLAGCGSGGGNFAGVTPVMADTRGTFRLSSATVTTTPAPGGGVASTTSFNSGVLRLTDTNYSKVINSSLESKGGYELGSSVNTILNTREGAFTLSPNTGAPPMTGTYHVDPDVTLTLNYTPIQLDGGTLVSRTETWIKESDSPHFDE